MSETFLRYDSNLGDVSLFAIALYDGGFWDFANRVKSLTVTADCKVYLAEIVAPSDDGKSWYSAKLSLPVGGPFPIEIYQEGFTDKLADDLVYTQTEDSFDNEPVTLGDVERQLRIPDLSLEETEILQFVKAIREKAEGVTRRALIVKTSTLVFDFFPNIISLTNPPLISVDSIKYINTDGVETVLDPLSYRVIKSKTDPEQPSYIIPAYGLNWPSTRDDLAAVEVVFTCGYTIETCPKAIKQWILLNVGALYENREAVVTSGRGGVVLDLSKTLADSLLDKYRVARL